MAGLKHRGEKVISYVGAADPAREHMASYLLGELSADEQVQLERDYFDNDEHYAQLLVVEDELAFQYVEGSLSPERRARFEQTIGATERGRQNVEFARLLLQALTSSRGMGRPIRYSVLAAAAALVLSAAPSLWLAARVSTLRSELAGLRADSVAAQARIRQEMAVAGAAAAPLEASFLLRPGLSRSAGGIGALEVPAKAAVLRFELLLPPGAGPGSYAVAVRSAAGNEIWSHSATAAGGMVVAIVPAGLMLEGKYQIGVQRITAGEQPPELATFAVALKWR